MIPGHLRMTPHLGEPASSLEDAGYSLENYDEDMTVRLHKGGCVVAKVTMQEMAEHRQVGDTPEMAFARALSFRRSGYTFIAAPQLHLNYGLGE